MPQSRERQYYKRYIDQAINDIDRAMGRAIELKRLLATHYLGTIEPDRPIIEQIDLVLERHYPQQLEALDITLQTLESAIDILKFLRTM